MRVAAGVAAALAIATSLAACGAAHDPTRSQIATYLAAVNRIERQLAGPLATVDVVDRQVTAAAGGHRAAAAASAGHLTPATEERRLQQAAVEIAAVAGRLRALAAPAPAAHLKALLVGLVERQADLTVQTRRLVVFIPGFGRSLAPLGPAVTALERVLSVNQASGAGAVALVYAQKSAALRTFAQRLTGILAALARLNPPRSSQPTYVAELGSLRRMRTAASTLAGDLGSGHTQTVAGVLRSFDRAAALPGSRRAQTAERAAVKAYDRSVGELGTLVAAANRERLRLAQRYR